MKIKQEDRIKYIRNPEKYIIENKLNKKQIEEFEDSIKSSPKPLICH